MIRTDNKGSVTHELMMEFRKPIHVGNNIVLHLRGIFYPEVTIGVDAPYGTHIARAKHPNKPLSKRHTWDKPTPKSLGQRAVVKSKRRLAKVLRLRANIDMPYYHVLKGALLVLYLRNHYYNVNAIDETPIDWLNWPSRTIYSEIEHGMWTIV